MSIFTSNKSKETAKALKNSFAHSALEASKKNDVETKQECLEAKKKTSKYFIKSK